ncbi:MAG: branched-chain amino acid aminotransferase [Aestuariivirga sp.]
MAWNETSGTAWTYFEDAWHKGNPAIMGAMDHAPWLGSCVFDGGRAFEGVAPDLDLHCRRLVRSAESFGLRILKNATEIEAIIREGIAKFPRTAELYLRPMYWAASGFVDVDPESTRFSVSVYDSPLPRSKSFSVTLSPFRRPSNEYAPTDAKAACHYPNSARAMRDAKARGFDNAVMLDPLGHVAELTTANIWCAKNGEAFTPVPNGCFLNGITRQRIISLLGGAGVKVHECSMDWKDFLDADEVFSTGNYSKVAAITTIEQRTLQPGPIAAKARELYWAYAHGK